MVAEVGNSKIGSCWTCPGSNESGFVPADSMFEFVDSKLQHASSEEADVERPAGQSRPARFPSLMAGGK
jgi:hypothetical protein